MVVKGNQQKGKPVATSEQIRMAQLTLEGKSTDDGSADIQKLIKRVIEMTSCSHAQAELALYDNDNDLGAAVDYILENSAQIDSWTEQKSKKEKKKEDDDRKVTSSRGQSSFRGRGGSYADRGGRGRGNGVQARGGVRNVVSSPPNVAQSTVRGRRGGYAAVDTGRPATDSSKTEQDADDVNNDWKNGPLEFKQSSAVLPEPEVHETSVPSSSSAPAPEPSQPSSGPISFAAAAAAAVRKEQMKKEAVVPTPAPVQSVPAVKEVVAEEPIVAPATSAEQEVDVEESYNESVHSVEEVEEDNDSVKEESSMSVGSPLQANTSWTNQLKNELGIGLEIQQHQSYSSVQVQSLAPEPAGVEFATETVPTGLVDYHFGFVDMPPAPVEAPAPSPPTPAALEPFFNTSRHSANAVPQSKPEVERVGAPNGDFSKAATPAQSFNHGNRSLGYGDTSSISYNPSSTDRLQASKAGHHQPQAPQQPQQHQQMFAPQMPYSFPYMNMYSPVAGVRPDDPYTSAALMQYPFGVGVDLANMMPGSNQLGQSATSQQMTSSHHRTDSHNMDGLKYQGQTNREQNQQPSNVAPPPGFGNPTSFMPQPPLSSMFMQQPYGHNPYSFMMPHVGNAGRQMYTQEDERKTYDKMGGAKQAQATPPPHFQSHGGGYLAGMNKKQQYTWNN